jgi:glucose-6-phosphate isomerase
MTEEKLEFDEDSPLDEELEDIIRSHFPDHLNQLSMDAIIKSMEADNQVSDIERQLELTKQKNWKARWHYFKKYLMLPTEDNLDDEIEFLEEQLPKAKQQSEKMDAFKEKVDEVKEKVDELEADDFM